MDNGILGRLFDLNRDGELDALEQAAEIGFIHDVLLADEEEDNQEDE